MKPHSFLLKAILCTSLCSNQLTPAHTQPVCGIVVENFNNTNGSTAGFTSSAVNSSSPGFVLGQTGQAGFLQKCGIPTGSAVYQITTPTYQSFASQTAVGYGFQLSGIVLVSRVVVLLQYITADGSISAVEVANFAPNYSGAGGSGTASVCQSFAISSFQGFNPGDRYRFTFQFTASSSSQANQCMVFDDFSTTGAASQAPLPVSFTGLQARRVPTGVELVWTVAGEHEVVRYEVQRSDDGRLFNSIGQVQANGGDVYAFIDGKPLPALAFYRVRNVDVNGQGKNSPVCRFDEKRSTTGLQVYPNPVRGEAALYHGSLTVRARLTIIATDGRRLRSFAPAKGVSTTVFQTGGLPPGKYLLRLDDGSGRVETTSFIKE